MPVRLAVQSKLSSSLPYTEVQPSASNFSALRRVCAFTLSVDVLVRVDANMGLRPVDDHLGRVHICDFDFDSLARRAVARTCTLTYTAFYNGDRISVKQFFKFS